MAGHEVSMCVVAQPSRELAFGRLPDSVASRPGDRLEQ